jgi:hypothetical protein
VNPSALDCLFDLTLINDSESQFALYGWDIGQEMDLEAMNSLHRDFIAKEQLDPSKAVPHLCTEDLILSLSHEFVLTY